MKLVIDIPDDDYMVLEKWFRLENLNGTLEQRLFCAVANGTVLPKGHGELIDKDVVLDMMNHGILEEYITTMGGVIHADR